MNYFEISSLKDPLITDSEILEVLRSLLNFYDIPWTSTKFVELLEHYSGNFVQNYLHFC